LHLKFLYTQIDWISRRQRKICEGSNFDSENPNKMENIVQSRHFGLLLHGMRGFMYKILVVMVRVAYSTEKIYSYL